MFLAENTVVLVVDLQEKLVRLMRQSDELIRAAAGLIRAARILDIPVIVTEQAPEKIGRTVPEIAAWIEGAPLFAKRSFSCLGDAEFERAFNALGRRQVIVAGIETHVCVYQTVWDLIARTYQTQVAADAVSSRSEIDKQVALARMAARGAQITTFEAAVCELLRSADHKNFREVMALIK